MECVGPAAAFQVWPGIAESLHVLPSRRAQHSACLPCLSSLLLGELSVLRCFPISHLTPPQNWLWRETRINYAIRPAPDSHPTFIHPSTNIHPSCTTIPPISFHSSTPNPSILHPTSIQHPSLFLLMSIHLYQTSTQDPTCTKHPPNIHPSSTKAPSNILPLLHPTSIHPHPISLLLSPTVHPFATKHPPKIQPPPNIPQHPSLLHPTSIQPPPNTHSIPIHPSPNIHPVSIHPPIHSSI